MEFYKHDKYCFSCYVIKSEGETAKKVLYHLKSNAYRNTSLSN